MKGDEEVTVKSEGLSWWTLSDVRGILSGIFTKAGEWRLWDTDLLRWC